MGNLTTPESVQKLQAALHAKAKGSPGTRFYALYDKVYRADVLLFAYRRCRANDGVGGVDDTQFADIEAYGVARWCGELAQVLREKQYRCEAVRRVFIKKSNGKLRGLGIPTIRDRVVQTAVGLVIEPIFEADLAPEQHAYRADRSALSAVGEVHRLLNTGHCQIIDADLAGYFDSIPHVELMKSVARRIVDGQVLHLIKMWLEAAVEEQDKQGGVRQRTTRNRDQGQGTPQGAPISPLLSNIYMRRFIVGWEHLGYAERYGAHIVNYADDLVICCKRQVDEAMNAMRQLMTRLKLTINEDKTRLCKVPQEHFDFLSYTFGRCYSKQTGKAYLGTRPAKKSIRRMTLTISAMTTRKWTGRDATELVMELNSKLRGWANYFCLGPVSPSYRLLDSHVKTRLRRWLCVKHKETRTARSRYPDEYLYDTLGLVRLPRLTQRFPWAKA